jgi:acetolactate synthase-1/3 small subunit
MNEETMIQSNVPPQAEGLEVRNGVPTIFASGEDPSTLVPGVNVGKGNSQLHTISVLVENQPGVLARVAHVFARRGFNLESLAVSRTEDPTVSRMTIVVAGDDVAFEQMGKQIFKLIDVIKVIDHTRDDLVGRELALIKVRAADASTRVQLLNLADEFGADLVDISDTTLTIEATAPTEKLDGLQKQLEAFEILELVRTGLIVLVRGEKQT